MLLTVSVPLRGKGRDQHRGNDTAESCRQKVSVPLRGKGRDQRLGEVRWELDYSMFPSPCGEKVGINSNNLPQPAPRIISVSVPLRGKGRDQLSIPIREECMYKYTVSVPLRGKGRDQQLEVNPESLKSRILAVSVPLRGKGRDQLPWFFRTTLLN